MSGDIQTFHPIMQAEAGGEKKDKGDMCAISDPGMFKWRRVSVSETPKKCSINPPIPLC
jgi:hypothetical protein